MASMQVISGSSGSAGSSGQSAALDPLMAGFSAEAVAAAAGQAGSDTPENPFAHEFSAALAALEAQQATAMAQALADQALINGQLAKEGEILSVEGQNLPFDPAFQQAVLATFAAVNGAVQGQLADPKTVDLTDSGVAGADQSIMVDPNALTAVQVRNAVVQGVDGVTQVLDGLSADSAAQVVLAAQSAVAPGSLEIAKNPEALADPTFNAQAEASQGPSQASSAAVSLAAAAHPAPSEVLAGLQGVDGEAAIGVQAPAGSAGAVAQVQTLGQLNASATAQPVTTQVSVGAGTQAQSGGGNASADDSSQQQAANAAALAAAAAPKAQVDSGDVAGKETSLAGSLVNDAGNVVVTAKANAEGVAAAADTARQSAQRIDATSGTGAAQTAESAAARAESKLEAARASLGSGPLNVEVLKLTKQGGGRAVLEVTPPNQGPIRLDLQLDGAGRASLVVEGLTEAMKARLESSAHFLRQDMAQMGLALNLEMRERNDSNPSAMAFNQGQFGQSGSNGRDGTTSAKATTVGAASGNTAAAGGSTSGTDGIHLVA